MNFSRLGTPVVHGDLDQQFFGICLGVFDENIEIPIVIEYTSIQQLILEVVPGTLAIRFHEITIWKLPLGILVQILHIGMGRRAVQIEVVLLHVFAMIAFAIRETEETFL